MNFYSDPLTFMLFQNNKQTFKFLNPSDNSSIAYFLVFTHTHIDDFKVTTIISAWKITVSVNCLLYLTVTPQLVRKILLSRSDKWEEGGNNINKSDRSCLQLVLCDLR